MSSPVERPTGLDALMARGQMERTLGPSWSDVAATYSALEVQGDQIDWDWHNTDLQDAYSVLAGDYHLEFVPPFSSDPSESQPVHLHSGRVENYSDDDYSGERFVRSETDPLKARILKVGTITLHVTAWHIYEEEVYALQFEGNDAIYPALRKTIRYGGTDGDQGPVREETDVLRLGYVPESLFEVKVIRLGEQLPGIDYFRPGYITEERSNGERVVEPDGTSWLHKSALGTVYSSPADEVGE